MIISKTPLRMSFFGGGSDFEGYWANSSIGYGSVISTAINKYIYIMVNKRFDSKIRIVYFGNEIVDDVNDIKHDIVRYALKLLDIKGGIEIVYSADLPMTDVGIGLSSSSALAVGLLHALHAYKNEMVTAQQLAKEACYIEINCIGQRIGIQDQYAVSFGGFRRYRFFNNGTVSADPVACGNNILSQLKEKLMLFYTGNGRDSRKIMSEQTENIAKKNMRLDELVKMTDEAYGNLINGNIDFWGCQLDRAWSIKKQFASGVSNGEIDEMYDKAKSAGALGGKILGAGGGGFMLLYVPDDKQNTVRAALNGYSEVDFDFEADGSRIIFIEE